MLHHQSTFLSSFHYYYFFFFESGSCKCSTVILMEPCANGLGTTRQITKSLHKVARCDENVLFSQTELASILERSMQWPGRALPHPNTATLLSFEQQWDLVWAAVPVWNLNNHLSACGNGGSLPGRRLPAINIFNYFCRWDTCLGSCKVHACTSRQSLASWSRTVPNELCE